jgi:hypothetical protein
MAMKIKVGGGKKMERIGEGTYMARIISVITTGLHQQNSNYPEKGECEKLMLTVELPTETMDVDGKEMPRLLSKEENLFLNEKSNLYKIIQACDPQADLSLGYDLSELISKECMVTIGTTSGGNDKITQWAGIMKGLTVPDQVHDSTIYDFYEPDAEVFEGLLPWVKELIKEASNYNEAITTVDTEMDDDEIPF